MEQKRVLRSELASRRRSVSPARREAAGRAVANHLLLEKRVCAARRVALYAALSDELPTRASFEALRARDQRCLFPRIRQGTLEFAAVMAWDELRPAELGVLSPPPEIPAEQLDASDVALVPGVAFDTAGRRIGRGGGHYDRAFADSAASPRLIGVAYALQIVTELPADSRDRAVDAIVTEQELRWLVERA